MRRLVLLSLVLLCALWAELAAAESGVRGRVAWRGELVEGVRVRAYAAIADIAKGPQLTEAEPTGTDGIYQLDLPPGRYYLTASTAVGRPGPGDLFCYYSGGPVQVSAGGYRNVGFNLVRVPAEAAPQQAKRSGIYGEVSFQGEPLERVYLYVYKDPGKGFKGPGYFVQPVAEGSFRLNLPPGEYYLLARKRMRGGQFGPIEIGDYFNYYYGNPLRVGEKQMHEVKIETITRLSMLEEDPIDDFRGVRGQVVNAAGQPQPGLYVFAYRDREMTGTPELFSEQTDAEGRFSLALPDEGPFYLLARQAFGGPAAGGEPYGKLLSAQGELISLAPGEEVLEVTIHVAPK